MPSLKEIADLIGGELHGDGGLEIGAVQALHRAGPGDIAFLARGKEGADLSGVRAGALIAARGGDVAYANLVLVDAPRLAFAQLLEHFHPRVPFWIGVAANASIAATAELGAGVSVGPFASIGEGARIGAGSEIHAGVAVYRGVTIGRDCLIYANAVIRENVEIGDRVIIHPGAVIGADGFGFDRTAEGTAVKVPQVGRVIIGDGCEIGANTCIDRSTIEETVLEANVKLDNLVQVGHNVRIGRDTAISAQTGISGSTRIGAGVIMGGQVGVADHVEIADGVMVAAKTGITGSVREKMIVAGIPHQEIGEWRRSMVLARNLAAMREKLRLLERKIKEMEEK
ncbi:MAG: UDP-3-O-(3-hydroxymyristoyl)glucosamine N-acyltransferase [Acidobacteria bacterium]|jgi:UDP-3-O-[3-hydroxymyristoyl] glucosamine N-acyltransferase|nr:UDP-3-O-(3-hydroxymyristoyl)glucosamine N-acyltransferase [Acidobacteriota bacterium]